MTEIISSDNNDLWTPKFMELLQLQRAPFHGIYDKFWRRERLYRYIYWLQKREHPPFNLLGSWIDSDIVAETSLWKEINAKCFTDDEVEIELLALFEDRFGLPWAETLALGTNPALAENGFPIWNVATGSLLPQHFGHCRIQGVFDHAPSAPGTNMGYSYRNSETAGGFDVYLYSSRATEVLSGISDSRLVDEIQSAWEGVLRGSETRGLTIASASQPEIETITANSGATSSFLSMVYSFTNKDGNVFWSCISLTGFCGCFAKTRYTAPMEVVESNEGDAAIDLMNSDQANFFSMYGGKT